MFPVAADRLSLAEIAALWAEEMLPSRTASWVQHQLEKAFWRGEIRGDGPTRLDKLRILKWGPVPTTDPNSWTEEDCEPAFNSVANFWPYRHVPGVLMSAPTLLLDVAVSRAEFTGWIIGKGYKQPTFWGAFPTNADAGGARERVPARGRKRGRRPYLYNAVLTRMREQIASGAITRQQLDDLPEKTLPNRFGCKSRETARKARNQILAEVPIDARNPGGLVKHSRHLTTNAK